MGACSRRSVHSAAIVFRFASAGFNLEHVGQSKTCEHFLEGDFNFAKCGNLRPGNGGKVKEKEKWGLVQVLHKTGGWRKLNTVYWTDGCWCTNGL